MFLLIALIAASWAFGTGWIAGFVMPPVEWAMSFYLDVSALVSGN